MSSPTEFQLNIMFSTLDIGPTALNIRLVLKMEKNQTLKNFAY